MAASQRHVDEEQLAAYALNALETPERLEVADHLATCTACNEALTPYLEVTASLVNAHQPAEPSAGLRGRIMTAVAALESPAVPSTSVINLAERRTGRSAWVLRVAATVLVLLTAGLSTTLALQSQRVADLETESTQLQAQLDDLQNVLYFTSSPGVSTVALEGDLPRPRAMLMAYPDNDLALLIAVNLDQLGDGEIYRLWLVDGVGSRYGVTTFNSDERGYASVWFRAPEVVSHYSWVRITRDPVAATEQVGGAALLSAPMELR
ncbi:MAG: anti-sigma factor [Chloroflexi bacterium]|nr:anti-sigma factor [Chloroflexota bacterium]